MIKEEKAKPVGLSGVFVSPWAKRLLPAETPVIVSRCLEIRCEGLPEKYVLSLFNPEDQKGITVEISFETMSDLLFAWGLDPRPTKPIAEMQPKVEADCHQ
jgi:hypothetical protein